MAARGVALAAAAPVHDPPPLLPTPRQRFQPQATTVYCDSRLTTIHCGRSTQLVQFAWTGTAVASHRPPHSARSSGGGGGGDGGDSGGGGGSTQQQQQQQVSVPGHTHSTGINILITWYIDGLSPPSLDHSLLWSKITMFDYLQRSYS